MKNTTVSLIFIFVYFQISLGNLQNIIFDNPFLDFYFKFYFHHFRLPRLYTIYSSIHDIRHFRIRRIHYSNLHEE